MGTFQMASETLLIVFRNSFHPDKAVNYGLLLYVNLAKDQQR